MKVQLQIPRREINDGPNPKSGHIIIKSSLPFFRSYRGSYTHRVRSGLRHTWDGKYSHTSVSFWCGGGGFPGHMDGRHGGQFFATAPEDAIICATCEGRATGAGQLGSHKLNGRMVKFSPRP